MKTLIRFLIHLCLAVMLPAFMVACDDGKSASHSEANIDLIQEIDELQFLIHQEMVMKSSDSSDRESVTKYFREMRNGLILLGQDPTDLLGYQLIERAVRLIRTLDLLERDRPSIFPLVEKIVAVTSSLATVNHVVFEVDTILYSFRFSSELDEEGFVNWPEGKWGVDWALDRSYAFIRGSDTLAYLVAPNFDLSKVTNPSFRIEHTINIDRNDRYPKDEWSRRAFLENSFKAYVSTNYTGGNPNDTEACQCQWEEVSLGEMPSSKDFHTVSSVSVNLSKYVGEKNVSIALVYDTNNLGRHYITWQVSYFELSGNGTLLPGKGREKQLLKHAFDKKKLEPFHVLNQTPEASEWQTGGFKSGSYDFVKIASSKGKNQPVERTSSLLLSPLYTVKGAATPILSISEVIRFFGQLNLSQLKILISTDYQGGNIESATWVPITRDPDKEFDEGSWEDNLVTFDLPVFNGSFSLLFWFDVSAGDVTWEILNFSISDKKGSVRSSNYTEPPSISELN